MSYRNVFVLIALIFIASLVLLFTGVHIQVEAVDVPLHLFGGFAWALVALLLLKQANAQSLPQWFTLLFCVGVVMIIGSLWEVAEYAVDLLVNNYDLLPPMVLRDTLGDLVNDMVGAVVAWIIFKKRILNS